MKKFCWIYLILFTADFILSVISTFALDWRDYSDGLSTLLMLLSSFVFVFAITKQMRPRWLFSLLSLSYLVVSLLFGIGLTVLLIQKIGIDAIPEEVSLEFLASHFSWFWYAFWPLITYLGALSVVGLKFFMKVGEQVYAED